MDHRLIYLLHIFIVAPLFWYIGSNGPETNPRVFQILQLMSIVIALHHGIKLMKITSNDKFNELSDYTIYDNENDIIDTFKSDDKYNNDNNKDKDN
jgi:hypothetical protein